MNPLGTKVYFLKRYRPSGSCCTFDLRVLDKESTSSVSATWKVVLPNTTQTHTRHHQQVSATSQRGFISGNRLSVAFTRLQRIRCFNRKTMLKLMQAKHKPQNNTKQKNDYTSQWRVILQLFNEKIWKNRESTMSQYNRCSLVCSYSMYSGIYSMVIQNWYHGSVIVSDTFI